VLGGRVKAFPHGLSSRDEEVEFSYFPHLTILSSSHRNHANVDSERSRVSSGIVELIRQGRVLPHLKHVPRFLLNGIVEHQLQGMRRIETHRVRVRPLSAVIDEEGVGRIDLLKIDVEGAELEVLNGVDTRHWPLIHQTVIEVESFAEKEPDVRALLESKGFRVESVQDEAQKAGRFGMVYAVRG
jgi:FkbM family methyltransferase